METTLAHSLPIDERTLIRRAQAGDIEAFGTPVSQYMRRAYYTALELVGSHDDALDLSQEVFSRGLSCPHVDPNRSFYTWLYTILRRLCFNFLRDRNAQSQKLAEAAGWLAEEARARVAAQSPSEAPSWPSSAVVWPGRWNQLPDRQREVLVLKEFEGLRYQDARRSARTSA